MKAAGHTACGGIGWSAALIAALARGRRLAALAAAALLCGAGAGTAALGQGKAAAPDGALARMAQECLGCHGTPGLEKKLRNGETLSLAVQGPAFAKSVHNRFGCAVCHAAVTLENHPPSKTKIASLRDYSVAMAAVCGTCHRDKLKQYDTSIHAALVREGHTRAPICTDCHRPHAVMSKAAYDAASGAPCSKCHSTIFKAYAGSVHGQATLGCAECHHAHEVSGETTGEQLKGACLGCHQDALAAHRKWLPNAEQHFEAVSCPACHSPAARRKVDLRLYDNVAQQRIAEKAGVPQFQGRARSADATGGGLNAIELNTLLRGFNRPGIDNKTTLRGRLEVSSGVEAHQLARSDQAIRDCVKCHRQGADPFQMVTVSVVGPDGRLVRYDADPEVLNSAISVDSVGGFYAIGGTRIGLLDWLVALALLGGIGVPVCHFTIRWLVRRYAKRIGGHEDS